MTNPQAHVPLVTHSATSSPLQPPANHPGSHAQAGALAGRGPHHEPGEGPAKQFPKQISYEGTKQKAGDHIASVPSSFLTCPEDRVGNVTGEV